MREDSEPPPATQVIPARARSARRLCPRVPRLAVPAGIMQANLGLKGVLGIFTPSKLDTKDPAQAA